VTDGKQTDGIGIAVATLAKNVVYDMTSNLQDR